MSGMDVRVELVLRDVDLAEWEGRRQGAPATVDYDDPATRDRISREIRAHVENVILDLYQDQGWIATPAPPPPVPAVGERVQWHSDDPDEDFAGLRGVVTEVWDDQGFPMLAVDWDDGTCGQVDPELVKPEA